MRLPELSDHFRILLSSAILFVNHGMRDNMITAIPNISSNVTNSNGDILGEIRIFITTLSLEEKTQLFIDYEEKQLESVLNTAAGWTTVFVGGTLSTIHWGWLITLVASPFLIRKLGFKAVLVVSLLTAGLMSLLNELAGDSATKLLTTRAIQGVFQGCCYPIVYVILEGVNTNSNFLPYFFIFLAPWCGSGLGTLLGWASNPFTGAYVFGSLGILLGVAALFIPLKGFESAEKPKQAWKECLTSSAVWACVLLQASVVWALHLLLVGLSFTLQFRMKRRDLLWTVFVTLIMGGVVSRIVALIAMSLLRNHHLSSLNRKRLIVFIGSLVLVLSLVTIGIAGINHEFMLFGMTVFAVCGGITISLVGVRANLHDLGPLFPTPFLIFGSIGATAGAGAASLLFPIIAQIGDIDRLATMDTIDEGPWMTAWIFPVVVVVVAWLVHLFFVSVIPLPHQTSIAGVSGKPNLNNSAPDASKQDTDAKSFKSTKSALSFKTAVSRQRTRTVSFKTVDENIEADLQSVQESIGTDCLSIVQDDDEQKDDMKSVKSGAPSFKSVAETFPKRATDADQEVILRAQELDRTTAWLSTHHLNGAKPESARTAEQEIVNKNILLALQW